MKKILISALLLGGCSQGYLDFKESCKYVSKYPKRKKLRDYEVVEQDPPAINTEEKKKDLDL